MKAKRIISTISVCTLIVLYSSTFGQGQNEYCYENIADYTPHLSVGSKKYGIGFGNFVSYNGINFCFIDKTCRLNGLGVSIVSPLNSQKHSNGIELGFAHNVLQMNGVSIGILAGLVNYNANGIQLAGLFGEYGSVRGINMVGGLNMCESISGFSLTGLYSIATQHNGIGTSLLAQRIDESANGLFISGLMFTSDNLNGLSFSTINMNKKTNGILIGIYNLSEQHNGIQIGLINKINENPIPFRTLPLLNINFSKDPIRRIEKDSVLNSNGDSAKYSFDYFPSGILKRVTITSNKRTLSIKESYENEKLKYTYNYENDTLVQKYFYSNGNLKYETKYLNGAYLGNYTLFDKKGRKIDERSPNHYYPKNKFQSFWRKKILLRKRKVKNTT